MNDVFVFVCQIVYEHVFRIGIFTRLLSHISYHIISVGKHSTLFLTAIYSHSKMIVYIKFCSWAENVGIRIYVCIFSFVRFRKSKSLLCNTHTKKQPSTTSIWKFALSCESSTSAEQKNTTYLLFVRIVNRFKSDRLHRDDEHGNEAHHHQPTILDKHCKTLWQNIAALCEQALEKQC